MYYKYGSYTHVVNDAALSVTRKATYDGRGMRRGVLIQHSFDGWLTAANSTALTTAANAMALAYSFDGYDAGLYEDSGTRTSHFLQSATSLGGTRVVSGPDFPFEPGTYTTYMPYKIVVEAEYPVAQNDDLKSWEETIEWTGTGGQRWRYIETLYGEPQKQVVNERTVVRAVQSGSAVGFTRRPSPPAPLWPTAEHEDLRNEGARSPARSRNKLSDYEVRWAYFYEATSRQSLTGEPTAR